MKYVETLTKLSGNGKSRPIRAIHRWPTGAQILVFPTVESFERFKAHVSKQEIAKAIEAEHKAKPCNP